MLRSSNIDTIVLTMVTALGDPLAERGIRKILQWRLLHHPEHVQEARRRRKSCTECRVRKSLTYTYLLGALLRCSFLDWTIFFSG